uniref:Putative secreted protein n=1 Tax=Amblyomma triste TaxID=251400 RepID=A0A023G1Y7_AMBTT
MWVLCVCMYVCACAKRFPSLTTPVQACRAARCVWSSLSQSRMVCKSVRGAALHLLRRRCNSSAPRDYQTPYDVCFAFSVLSTDVAKTKEDRKKNRSTFCVVVFCCASL